MMLTVIALLGVVIVLLVTGQRASAEARFSLSSAPSNTTVVTGGSAEFQLQLTAGTNFRGTVAMATSVLPDGVQASFDHPRVSLGAGRRDASVRLTVLVGSAVPTGSLGLGVVASSGRQLVTGNLTLRIEPASITDAGPPPPTSSPAGVVISGTGTPVGVLRPGARLPVSLLLVNPHSGPVVIGRLSIRVQSTSKSGCRPSDFSISQFSGHYPLRLAAGQSRTLAKFGVPATEWPRLIMLNLPANRVACAGVQVRLRVLGTGTFG